jgi:hypothetical protein
MEIEGAPVNLSNLEPIGFFQPPIQAAHKVSANLSIDGLLL